MWEKKSDEDEEYPIDDEDLQLKDLRKKLEIKKVSAEIDNYGLLEKIKNYLLLYYVPVQDASAAEFHYTTAELHKQMLNIYPNEFILTADLVASWMHGAGFTFYDYGEMRFEWMLKKV